jgi:hypothetical protein
MSELDHYTHAIRALRALNMRRQGMMLNHIGIVLDVTKERARQMVKLGQELERRASSTDPWDQLNARIRNALDRDGCPPTPDGVVEHFKTRDWKRVPAFGKKAFATLNAWLVRHGKDPIA